MLIFIVLILAIRGTDLQFINSDKKYVAATAFLFGMMAMAAGKSWSDLVKGVHDLPASVVVNGPMGDPGTGIATLVPPARVRPRPQEEAVGSGDLRDRGGRVSGERGWLHRCRH
jgi:hypothetical protein